MERERRGAWSPLVFGPPGSPVASRLHRRRDPHRNRRAPAPSPPSALRDREGVSHPRAARTTAHPQARDVPRRRCSLPRSSCRSRRGGCRRAGRVAADEISAAATTATTRTGSSSSATAPMPAITAAPPAMSAFMSCMLSAGSARCRLASKVIALPTKPSTRSSRVRRARLVTEDDQARPVELARPTADSAHASSSMRAGSNASTVGLGPANSAARAASTSGVGSSAASWRDRARR